MAPFSILVVRTYRMVKSPHRFDIIINRTRNGSPRWVSDFGQSLLTVANYARNANDFVTSYAQIYTGPSTPCA